MRQSEGPPEGRLQQVTGTKRTWAKGNHTGRGLSDDKGQRRQTANLDPDGHGSSSKRCHSRGSRPGALAATLQQAVIRGGAGARVTGRANLRRVDEVQS